MSDDLCFDCDTGHPCHRHPAGPTGTVQADAPTPSDDGGAGGVAADDSDTQTDARDAGDTGEPGGRGSTQASDLVRLAEERYWLGTDTTGNAFAAPLNGPRIARLLRGHGSLRAELAAAFVTDHGKVPSSSALADAMMVLEGRALVDTGHELALRVGRADGGLVLDLGDDDGRAVVIGPGRWSVREASPILFRRTSLTAALPVPSTEGDLDRLRSLINVADADWPLLCAVLVAALIPDIPHPIIAFLGRQGTAKTTTAKWVASLVDPSAAPTRSAPRDVEAWVVTADGSWCVVLDNVSRVQEWLSDALCRAVTGDALVRRRLYTDGDLSVIRFRRVVAITSIDPGALAGDLAERLVPFELEPIPEESRQQDEVNTAAFEEHRGAILGGLLDLVADVLAVLPDVHLDRYPAHGRLRAGGRCRRPGDGHRGARPLPRWSGPRGGRRR